MEMTTDIRQVLKNTRSFIVPVSTVSVAKGDQLVVKGQPVRMTHSAMKDLLNMVGMTQKFMEHLNSTVKNGAGYRMLQHLMKAVKGKVGRLKLYIDSEGGKVVRIADADNLNGSAISADAMEQLLEFTGKTSGGRIERRDMMVMDGGTRVAFNLMYNDEITLAVPNEDIVMGKQIVWDLLGPTGVTEFVERLICSNGMTGIVPDKDMRYLDGESSTSDWYNELFRDINEPNKLLIDKYERKMLGARDTFLSVAEVESISEGLYSSWNRDSGLIDTVFGNDGWKAEYERRGIDIGKASEGKKRNCPTPIKAWDAINLMTDLASHKYNSTVSNKMRRNTQRKAGKMLNGTWDANVQVSNAPAASDLLKYMN